MIALLFFLSVVAIPFSDIMGLPLLGEMQRELSAHLFLLTMGTALVLATPLPNQTRPNQTRAVSLRQEPPYLLPQILLLFFVVIALSFVMNFSTILSSQFRGRHGMSKFLTSSMVLGYGFGIAWLTYYLGSRRSWHTLIVKPVGISVVIALVFSAIEYFSWDFGVIGALHTALSDIVHLGTKTGVESDLIGGGFTGASVEGRIRSVSFEPPAFANYAGFAWPWLFAGWQTERGPRRWFYFALWVLLAFNISIASARTGLIMFVGSAFVLLALRTVYLPPRLDSGHLRSFLTPVLWSVAALALLAIILGVDSITDGVIRSGSGSNLTRWASNMAAYRMFADNPFFGFGFGQYGFHAIEYMPSWAWLTWEICLWFSDPVVIWPPVFSLYARFAGELGVLGLVVWVGLWTGLARAIVKATLAYQRATGALLLRSYPLVTSCFCVLFSGIPSDTLRTPMMWITLGLGCCFLNEIRRELAARAADTSVPASPDDAARPEPAST